MQFFTIDRIKQCSRHLENFHSSWIIPSFVFASNGVNRESFTSLRLQHGTDVFLDKFFNGQLIGLPELPNGNSALRPRFKDLMGTLKRENRETDFILHQDTKLWANAYSSRGYREMVARGELERQGADAFKLTDRFEPAFENNVPNTFLFEEFMVWLFAFSGFSNEINSWAELERHLTSEILKLENGFAPEFCGRFRVKNIGEIEWPLDLRRQRPKNDEFQSNLAPSLVQPAVVREELPQDDPVRSKVVDAYEKGALNFLFYGPPGTGKTWYAHKIARILAESNEERVTYMQFHPSISYDDFIEGYSPKIEEGNLLYKLEPKHFMRLADTARRDPNNTYVMLIDEISRGDPSRVFGELLTYIEPEYRNKNFLLSYSGEITSIPPNLVILATTNPYDRSVAELDDALIRRFYMIEFPPNRQTLEQYIDDAVLRNPLRNKLLHLFDLLNEIMPYGFGHAYLFGLSSETEVREFYLSKLNFIVNRALQYDEEKLDNFIRRFDELFPHQQPEQR